MVMAKGLRLEIPDSGFEGEGKRLLVLLKTDTRMSSIGLMGKLAELPGVREVHMTEGEWSFVLEVSGKPEKRGKELLHGLSRIPGVKEAKGVISAIRWLGR